MNQIEFRKKKSCLQNPQFFASTTNIVKELEMKSVFPFFSLAERHCRSQTSLQPDFRAVELPSTKKISNKATVAFPVENGTKLQLTNEPQPNHKAKVQSKQT